MAFGRFKEMNNENMDNMGEVKENTEKRRNQILELPEDYNDDFKRKIDAVDKKQDKENLNSNDKNWFERIKSFCIKEKNAEKNKENEETENKEPTKSRENLFKESLKVTESPEEIQKRNAEYGYPETVMERPKGGFERERTLEGESPSKCEALQEDNSENS